ncbi:hypothetical protein M8C21_012444, partial [Ambrosia artemisiifolia]
MQKRELKQGGGSGGSGTPAAKRGRPVGSTASNMAAAALADAAAPSTLLGPSLQIHSSFADQNTKRIVLALQSGLKTELTWAINALTLLSFKEKDDVRKDATPLAKIPGLLDALLQVIDDWRDISLPRELMKTLRTRSLGVNSIATGFGNDIPYTNIGSGSASEASLQKKASKSHPSDWWLAEDGLFNLDDEGRAEKQMCAVAASNVLRNFSFMTENEVIMGQHRHCLETLFQCMEDHATEKRAVQAIVGILGSSIKAWHCAAAELLGRLIINPDNEPFILPSASQIYRRLVDLLSLPAVDAQAAAVGALYNLAEINMDCRLKLASERWAVDRLLKVIKAPHPVPEVCRKAAMILESLVSEPQNRPTLLSYENAFAEILFSDGKHSDTFARILFELTSKPNSKVATARGIWGIC